MSHDAQVHIAEEFLSWLRREYPFIKLNLVPAGCTSKVQIADIILNRPFKVCMKKAFMDHATNDVLQQVRSGIPTNQISHDLSLSSLKPLVVDWMLAAHQHLKGMEQVVREAYSKTGMDRAWDDKFQV